MDEIVEESGDGVDIGGVDIGVDIGVGGACGGMWLFENEDGRLEGAGRVEVACN